MGTIRDELDTFRQRAGVPAVIGAVVLADGELADAVSVDVVGETRRDRSDELASVDDQWHIGSCGKSMTAVLYARLVEAGHATWDTPIADLVPDLDVHTDWREPTIDDLLRCRAGVAPNPSPRQMLESWRSTESPSAQRTGLAEQALSKPPSNPGTYAYSNLSYVLVGAAIDRLAGMPYEAALSEFVLDPLGIESLGYGPPPRVCGHKPRFRLGPIMVGSHKPAVPDDNKSDNPTVLTPAGRMHLTMHDWAAFIRIFLNDGAPLLTPATIQHLLELPTGEPKAMAMGFVSGETLGGSYGMQGSNTLWAATALLDHSMKRAALVVANDGRITIVQRTAMLAQQLLNLTEKSNPA